jgi:hypothetical protein
MGFRSVLMLGIFLLAQGLLYGRTDAGETRETLFGVSTFPFKLSPAASEQTFRIAEDLSDVYVVQLDNGVPWSEAASDAPFPVAVRNKWRELAAHAPSERPVYLALAPLAEDRKSLAPSSEGSTSIGRFHGAAFDDPTVVKAYVAYALKAVRYFKPTYVNLGLEAGELAHRRPGDWDPFVTLIRQTTDALRQEFPTLKIGISFGLQSLMEKATAERARQIIAFSDYVGISFYPYMSAFHQKFGAPPLPAPPDQWRVPLDWLASFAEKPIAICETGYNTQDVSVQTWGLQMKGSEAEQKDYVSDLARYAKRDGYLFAIYYFPIDIGPLIDTLPKPAAELASMWRENGLLDAELKPKPAQEVWKSILAAKYDPAALKPSPAMQPKTAEQPQAVAPAETRPVVSVGFKRDEDLCQAPSPARVSLVATDSGANAMQWEFPAGTQKWTWCARPAPAGGFPQGAGMRFRIRSDVDGPVFVEMKAASGAAYFAMVDAGLAWRDVRLRWSDFAAESNKGSARDLQPEAIKNIVLADEGKASAPGNSTRRIWISDWIAK